MTANQIRNRELEESRRHNKTSESQNQQDVNTRKRAQRETRRHNKETEKNERRGQDINREVTERGQDVTKRGQNLKAATDVFGSVAKIVGSANDPSWYNLDKQLVIDAASLSYESAIGYLLPAGYTGPKQIAAPGVCAIAFAPMIGQAADNDLSLATLVARNWYADIRRKNSGGANYDPPDLFMYMMAVDSGYMLAACVARQYSVALTAKGRNRYYPQAMAQALRFDIDDALENLASYRMRLNQLLISLNSIYVPEIAPIFKRHVWMCSNIFKDSDIHKSQEYVFVPDLYYTWDEDGGLTPTPTPIATLSVQGGELTNIPKMSAWLDALSNVVSTLLEDQDVGNIAGDIKRAADNGAFSLWSVNTIPDDYHIESTFSLEVLSQINATTLKGVISPRAYFAPGHTSYTRFYIGQTNTGEIFQGEKTSPSMKPRTLIAQNSNGAYATGSLGIGFDQFPINMYKDSPSPDDTMVASRLVVPSSSEYYDTDNVHQLLQAFTAYGTEVALSASYYTIKALNENTSVITVVEAWDGMDTATLDSANNDAYLIIDAFDWGPSPRTVNYTYEEGYYSATSVEHSGMDYCNYVFPGLRAFSNMHRVAVMSEYGIPSLVKYNK